MKIIYSSIIPFKGFVAVNLFGCLFVRKEYADYFKGKMDYVLNHEKIHTAQMKELGYIFFYIIYFLEWLYRLVFHTSDAYRGISFEVEAYNHQLDLHYLANRKHFNQWRKQ